MVTVGVDIEEVSRFSKNPYEKKKKLYEKIFTPEEIKFCLSKSNPYQHFTARFCAKEAAIKALDNEKIELKKIEVKMIKRKPILSIAKKKTGLVSISHTKNYALAVVLIL